MDVYLEGVLLSLLLLNTILGKRIHEVYLCAAHQGQFGTTSKGAAACAASLQSTMPGPV